MNVDSKHDISPTSSTPVASSYSSRTTTSGSSQAVPEVGYSGIDDFFRHVDKADGDTLIVRDVSFENCSRIDLEREKRGRRFRLSLWSTKTRVLIVTMPKAVHEQLHAFLNTQIILAIAQMRLDQQWDQIAATTYTETDDTGNTISTAEADAGGTPAMARGVDEFPTLVIEARYSQCWHSLRTKAQWWFNASHYDVKFVLLTKLDTATRQIRIEKWKNDPSVSSPPRYTTRAQAARARTPGCIQTVVIGLADGLDKADPTSYEVDGAPLRLEFEDLFLRNPDNQSNERDIELDANVLRGYAVKVWARVH